MCVDTFLSIMFLELPLPSFLNFLLLILKICPSSNTLVHVEVVATVIMQMSN